MRRDQPADLAPGQKGRIGKSHGNQPVEHRLIVGEMLRLAKHRGFE